MTIRSRLIFPALVAAGVLWGTTVPLSKVALAWLAPGWLAFARFALAGALLAIVTGPRLRAAASPAILITGAAGYGGSVLLQNLGIERTSVTHAALLIGATPVLVAVMAAMAGHGIARPMAWAGFALSLAGVGFIAGGQGGGSSLSGDGLVLAGQLASAGFTVSQARLLRGRDPVAVTALQLLAAAVAVLPAALAGGPVPAHGGGATVMLATAALVLVGTVAPTTLFAFAQSRVTADVAGAFLNLEPLFGAAIGIAMFGNPLGAAQLEGGAGIVAGIGLSTYQVARDERARRPGLTARPGPVQPQSPMRLAAAERIAPPSPGTAGQGRAWRGDDPPNPPAVLAGRGTRPAQPLAEPRPAASTTRSAIARLAVAAGDGALRTSSTRSSACSAKSSTRLPSRATAWARTPDPDGTRSASCRSG
jgi:O-acetylserine/cysteine efflux transporter